MARATGPPRNSEKKSGLIPVRRVTNRRAVRGKASKRKDQPRRHDGYKHADGDVGRQAWPRRPGCPSQSHDCNWLGAGKISAATRKIPGASVPGLKPSPDSPHNPNDFRRLRRFGSSTSRKSLRLLPAPSRGLRCLSRRACRRPADRRRRAAGRPPPRSRFAMISCTISLRSLPATPLSR
jgi:hypothetical protein